MIEPTSEITRREPQRNLIPFVVVVAVSIALCGISILSAIDAQSRPGPTPAEGPMKVEWESPATPIRALTLRQFPYELLLRVAPLALIAGAALIIAFAAKAVLGGPLLANEWRFQPAWRPLDTLVVTLLAVGVLLPLQFLFPRDPQKPISVRTWVAELIFRILAATVILMVVKSRQRRAGELEHPFAALGLLKHRLWPHIRAGHVAFLCFIAVAFCLTLLENRIVQYFHLKVIPQDPVELMKSARTLPTQIALPILAVVVAPFTEELFFRGFLQGMLRKHCGSGLAVFATAFFFAAAHANIFIFVQLFILGLMLGYLYDRTQSLAAPMTLHF